MNPSLRTGFGPAGACGALVTMVSQSQRSTRALQIASLAMCAALAGPAVAPASGADEPPPPSSSLSPVPPGSTAYHLPGPLRRVIPGRARFRAEEFDLQSRLGSGTPVGLIFWEPGQEWSERALVELGTGISRRSPRIELYAVAGRRAEEREEQIQETFGSLDLPERLPLLIDDGRTVAKGLNVEDVPRLVLFDGRGRPVVGGPEVPGIESLAQRVTVGNREVAAAELVRRVGTGEVSPNVQRVSRYYPASELEGRCAPSFGLARLENRERLDFPGKSASGRATMLLFWSPNCEHCRVEIPRLVSWLSAHPGQLDVVSVIRFPSDRATRDSERRAAEDYVRATGIAWPVLDDVGGAVHELFDVVSTPTALFVAANGTVVEEWFHAHTEGFDAAIEGALAKAAAAQRCEPRPPRAMPRMAFQMTDPSGAQVELASLLGQPTVVHLWATWCRPCIEELPAVLAFRRRLEGQGLGRLILVSVEGESAGPLIAAFDQRARLGLHSYFAPTGGIADQIDLSYHMPRTYLLGRGGELLGIRHGKQDWRDPIVADVILSVLENAPRPSSPEGRR